MEYSILKNNFPKKCYRKITKFKMAQKMGRPEPF